MLKDPIFIHKDPTLALIGDLIAKINGNRPGIIRLREGVYQSGNWNFNHDISWRNEWPEDRSDWRMLYDEGYGVCDDFEQVLAKHPQLVESEKPYCVSIVELRRENQHPDGGWRWEKWGEYIGTQNSQCEYLYDEPEIERVYTYHYYELQPHQVAN